MPLTPHEQQILDHITADPDGVYAAINTDPDAMEQEFRKPRHNRADFRTINEVFGELDQPTLLRLAISIWKDNITGPSKNNYTPAAQTTIDSYVADGTLPLNQADGAEIKNTGELKLNDAEQYGFERQPNREQIARAIA